LCYYLMLYQPWNWIHFYLEQLYMYDVSMYCKYLGTYLHCKCLKEFTGFP
jgi:hypothetical protein